ncbi:MAG TPA: YicC/YloC family endoribonuclease [Thermoanaerobaculia bacterium]|nr:YicC/YloC family endoribonuclease [Thermoanaerobaculia bacterium]
MRSMTGFGQAAGRNSRHAVTVTLRGVNHRFLEIKLRLGDDHPDSESALQELLAAELHRGRVDATVEVTPLAERDVAVEVNRAVVMAAHGALEELVAAGLLGERLTAGDLLRLPEALSVRVAPDVWDDADRALLAEVAGRALAQLVAARELEGGKLRALLAERLEALAALVGELPALREAARRETAEALRARIAELVGEPAGAAGPRLEAGRLDPGRLEQEVAHLVERSDVAEEIDRLGAHVEHFRELLDADAPVGKRLDFLAQEVLRELNTLGAKSRNTAITRRVLDAKVLCEQLREQVQNVE